MRIALPIYVLSICVLWTNSLSAGNFKCWTDDKGVYNCGNVIPPEYSPKGHDQFDKRGRKVESVAPEKSKVEREAILSAEREQEIARIKAEKQEAEDRKLLDIYPSENAIMRARDSKLASIDAGIKVSKNQLGFYEKSLQQAQKASRRIYHRAERPNAKEDDKLEAKKLTKHLGYLKDQIKRFKQNIADKHADKDKIRQDFEIHMKNYREIKRRLKRKRPARMATSEGEKP